MLILDAIRRAETSREVCFLLTCYVDGLQFYDIAKRLPGPVFCLPVVGRDDVQARAMALQQALHLHLASALNHDERAMTVEIAEVFGEAELRLRMLEAPEHLAKANSSHAATV